MVLPAANILNGGQSSNGCDDSVYLHGISWSASCAFGANNSEGCPITPNPSGTPEGFMDTPLVNGKAYPVLHVAPEAYRFQILSAGNDRTLNLSLFLACGSGGSAAATNSWIPERPVPKCQWCRPSREGSEPRVTPGPTS